MIDSMITEEKVKAIYKKIKTAKKPLVVVLSGTQRFNLTAYYQDDFDKKIKEGDIPHHEVVGTYEKPRDSNFSVGLDGIIEDVEAASQDFIPQLRSSDPLLKSREIKNAILSQTGSFTASDIVKQTFCNRISVFNNINRFLKEGKIKHIGTLPNSGGKRMYAVVGTEAARRWYPSNDEMVMRIIESEGEVRPSAISNKANIPRESVKTSLRRMEQKGLVSRRNDGKKVFYRLSVEKAA